MKKKQIAILGLTIVISSAVIYLLMIVLTFDVTNKQLTTDIPSDLLCELQDENIIIAQHGYRHTYVVTDQEKLDWFCLLNSQRISAKNYIAPYEWDNTHPFLTTIYLSKYKDNNIPWDYSDAGIDNLNRTVAIIHIQDNIMGPSLYSFDDYDIIRVDNVNTDIVPSHIQAERIATLKEYTTKTEKTLILEVIPYVLRQPWYHSIATGFLKFLCLAWMVLLIPYYVFYLLSWRLL